MGQNQKVLPAKYYLQPNVYYLGGGVAGVILQDSKKYEAAKGSLWKEKKIFKTKNSLKAGIKQSLQDNCILQSPSSIWPTVEADKLADNDEIIITMTIAMKTFALFANREPFIDIFKKNPYSVILSL